MNRKNCGHRQPDGLETHPHWRRHSALYRLRRSKLVGWWMCIGGLGGAAITGGHGELAVIWCLLGTRVSFAFLDEYTQVE